MSERNLSRIGAGLLLAGAVALAVQILVSLASISDADEFVPFLLVVSGPQLVAGLWVLLPWGTRRAARYLLPILIGLYVASWNISLLAQGSSVDLSPLQSILIGGSLVIQAVAPLIAAGVLAGAWWVGRRSRPDVDESGSQL